MKVLQLTEEEKIRLIYQLSAGVSGVVILITVFYGIAESIRGYVTSGVITVGETLVEIDWPLPYFAKPVTYLSFSLVALWISLGQLYGHRVLRISRFRRNLLAFIALLVAFGAAYEVLYNFSVWAALISAEAVRGQLKPDLLNIPYPNPKIPWNLVFATKMFLSLFFMSLYSYFYLHRIGSSKEKRIQP